MYLYTPVIQRLISSFMDKPAAILPKRWLRFSKWMNSVKIPSKISLLIIGFLSTLWFLFRVIPKPSRAAYPCMQAAAPFMSAFVIYLTSLTGSVIAFRRFRQTSRESRFLLASIFLLISMGLFFITVFNWPARLGAEKGAPAFNYFTPNEPIGEAIGIYPGRVVWIWDTASTNPVCTNTSNENGVIDQGDDGWFMEKNNNAAVIDSMVLHSLIALTGAPSGETAWDSLFRFYNRNHGHGNTGYSSGQKILLKVNATTAYGGLSAGRFNADLGRTDHLSINAFSAETNPYVVLSLLKQLVNVAGVPESMIYIGDPARNIYKEFYELWHTEFPDVNILGNDLIHPELNVAALGRLPVAISSTPVVFWSDQGTVMPDALNDPLFTIFQEIDYLINIPTMKAHSTAGITLVAKNHFGSFTREWAMHLHPGLFDGVDDPVRVGYGLYRVQTDIMMHKMLSGKNLLLIVDGLYPGEDALGVPEKWLSPPFYNNWCSSLFMSLDPVAIESVCHDFLRTEYYGPTPAQNRPNWFGVDDYLHQSADSNLWAEGIQYDPDNDGVLFSSLGAHEHWNDSLNKQYTRNLGTGNGIELFRAHDPPTGLDRNSNELVFSVYPNPFSGNLTIHHAERYDQPFIISGINGTIYTCESIPVKSGTILKTSHLPAGIYLLFYEKPFMGKALRIIKL